MVAIRCPKCGHESEKSIGWIKTHENFICSCGVEILLKSDEFIRKIDIDAANEISTFKRGLHNTKI